MTEFIAGRHGNAKFDFSGTKRITLYMGSTWFGMSHGKAFYKPRPGVILEGKSGLPLRQFFDLEREYKRVVGVGQIDPQEMQEWQKVTYTRTRKLRGVSTSARSTTVSPSPWLPSWKRPHGSDSSPDISNAG